MKLGVVTFTFGDNYGQRLQNYAVQKLLQEKGAVVRTLRQQMPHQSMKHKAKVAVLDLMHGIWLAKKRRHRAFEQFDAKYIAYEDDCFLPDLIPEKLNSYDAFVAGSDQIWSPYVPDADGSMFLTFAGEVPKISLSASMATQSLPLEKRSLYSERLSRFDHISVRESNAADIIKDLIGEDVPVLIDPTLMFDAKFWGRLASAPAAKPPERYALKYFLGVDSERVSRFESLCKKEDLPVIDLCGDNRFFSEGPSEFLHLVQHSSIVATDSYHGSIFAILFDKPLLIFDRAGTEFNMTDRFDTLAAKLGLGDWRNHNWGAVQSGMLKTLEVSERLFAERAKFDAYLDDALMTSRKAKVSGGKEGRS